MSSRPLLLAYEDYKYLLNRGYSRKPALDLVVSRYNLSQKERLFLYRCVHSDEEIEEVKRKLVTDPRELTVDGYNIALTLISLKDGRAYECDDGFVRDVQMGKRKGDPRVLGELRAVCEFLRSRVVNFVILLDSQVSMSGELAKTLREEGCNAVTSKTADKESLTIGTTVATNDFVLLMKSRSVFNLVRAMGFNPVPLSEVLSGKVPLE